MALGRISDRNLAKLATLSGGTWSGALPLANLLDESRIRSAPARQLTPADLVASQFEAAWAGPQVINLVAVFFHTLEPGAKYRLTVAGTDGDLGTPAFVTDWTHVYGAVFHSSELEFEDPNWFTLQLARADIDLYPRHLWIPLPGNVTTSKIRLEIDDSSNDAGFYDLGLLYVARTFTPAFNFERGRDVTVNPRDLKDEAPSGREIGEERTPRRTVVVSWSRLSENENWRLLDASARARTTRIVVFLPDADDPMSLLREAFPATFGPGPAAKFTWPGLGQSTATFREIIA